MPTGLAMARGFSASTSGLGGGKSTVVAVSSDAGVAGMRASVKNWFCTAAQTILFEPEVYSVRGVLGTQPPRRLLSNQPFSTRSEEHTSELQSRFDIVCRLLL